MYNMTFMNTSNNILDITRGINSNVNDLIGVLILLVLFVVLFISMKKYNTEVSFLVTSFISSIVGVFLYAIQFIGVEILIIPFILLIISVFINIMNK